MRRVSVFITFLCIACFAFFPALANSWGVTGSIAASYFSFTSLYNEYSALAQSKDRDNMNAVAMKNRYHVQLLILSADKKNKCSAVTVSTAALYQPEWSWHEALTLTLSKDKQLTVSYAGLSAEEYTFDLSRDDFPLISACIKNGYTTVRIQAENQALQYSDGTVQAIFAQYITLHNFSITQFPKSVEAVERMNTLLSRYTNVLPSAQTVAAMSNGKQSPTPVYSAPSAASYRAASGKASLSIGDSYQAYGVSGDWTLVEYSVSLRTSRIGYAKTDELKNTPIQDLSLSHETVTLQSPAFLTDDPHVSQHTTVCLQTDAKVTYLATLLPYHMYVEAEADGKTVRGFIPLYAVQTEEEAAASRVTKVPRVTTAPAPFTELEIPKRDFSVLHDAVSPIGFATVNEDRVNLRKKPKGDIIDKLEKGKTVYVQDTIVSGKTTWYQVSTVIEKRVYTGYIDSSFVDTIHDQYSRIVDIACSNQHVVLLHDDGTVSAIGDGGYREAITDGIDQWRNVVSVSASFLTSLGVTKDGHVLTTGFRCSDAAQWTNVLSLSTGCGNNWDFVAGITTGDILISKTNPVGDAIGDTLVGEKIKQLDYMNSEYGVVYLLEDGTVHASGSLFEKQKESNAALLKGLTHVRQLAVGNTHVAALLEDGTVTCVGSRTAAAVSSWHDIVQIAAGNDYTVGLQADGSVVFEGLNTYNIRDEVIKWQNMIKLTAAEKFVVGLRSDGTVVMAGEYSFQPR